MTHRFQHIGLIGKWGDSTVGETIERLLSYLQKRQKTALLEASTAKYLTQGLPSEQILSLSEMATQCDLVIVVGGDGTLLWAARTVGAAGIPLLGVNRGRLGFLADISPDDMFTAMNGIFEGDYEEEKRCLLSTRIGSQCDTGPITRALNDVVVHKWNSGRMIEFDTYIDGKFVNAQRSDGLIVSTPTGSTAYALSSGGPLLHPSLNALTLVSICPHTLSARPIVVSGDSQIEIHVTKRDREHVRVSCDGQSNLSLKEGDIVCISKAENPVRLLHPRGHDHYEILRAKLGWGEHPAN